MVKYLLIIINIKVMTFIERYLYKNIKYYFKNVSNSDIQDDITR